MERKKDIRKLNYNPGCIEEEFIVPLVGDEIQSKISFYCKDIKNGIALDLGCGSKPFKDEIEAFGLKYYSFDVNDDDTLDFVGEIDKELNSKLLETGPFDFILCTEVLEHVANWDKTFENFSKLLKPNGILLITAPHFYGLHEVPYDFWRPTSFAFEHFATKFNLKVKENNRVGTFWDMLGTLLAFSTDYHIKEGKINFKNKLILRILRLGKRLLLKSLKKRYLHENFKATCYMYQSNIVVLTK
jgi:SAM-dependent methyltransferase